MIVAKRINNDPITGHISYGPLKNDWWMLIILVIGLPLIVAIIRNILLFLVANQFDSNMAYSEYFREFGVTSNLDIVVLLIDFIILGPITEELVCRFLITCPRSSHLLLRFYIYICQPTWYNQSSDVCLCYRSNTCLATL